MRRTVSMLVTFACCFQIATCGRTKEYQWKPLNKSKDYEVRLINVKCVPDSHFTHNVTCSVKSLNVTYPLWSAEWFSNDDVQLDSIFAKLTVFRRMSNAEYRSYVVHNVTVNVCDAMSGAWDPIVNVFEKDLRKYSNFYSPCPRRGRLYFKAEGIDMTDFPQILPDGFYYLKVFIYTTYKNTDHVVVQVIGHFEIIPIGIERF